MSFPISRTDSRTVRSGENPLSCNMMPIRGRTARRSRGLCPKTRTVPEVALRWPSMISRVEVLPAPFVPSRA